MSWQISMVVTSFLPLFFSLSDPMLWTADQVIHWAVWVMKEFNIDEMEIGSIHIPGRELCAFSQEEFLQKVPNGEILWSHLELLRKCKSEPVKGFLSKSVCVSNTHTLGCF